MSAKAWTTTWPGTIDTDVQIPSVADGDLTDFTQLNTIKALFIAMETEIGETSPAAGSLRYRTAALEAAPPTHAGSHQNGGGDEISVAGLSGLLADDQNPVNHAGDHQNGGGDEISVAGLSGALADDQNANAIRETSGPTLLSVVGITDGEVLVRSGATVTSQAASVPALHAASHQNGGGDEISVAGLSGLLADDQNPVNHAGDHQNGGGDEISVAGLSGLLADDQNPVNHAGDHQNGGGDEISVAGLSGLLADDQNPVNHAGDHEPGGTDAMAVDAAAGTGSLRTLGSGATNACAGNDSRLSDSRAPTGSASGQLGGTYPDPDVRGLRTTAGGGTELTMGSVADGEYLKRSGTNIVGDTGGSVSPLTTKGDLFTYDTGDQRLPVGSGGQILVSDSGEATGLKWKSLGVFAPAVIDVEDDYPSSSVVLDTTNTYKQIYPGATARTFMPMTTGEHPVILDCDGHVSNDANSENFQFKVEFDDGINPPIVVGDDNVWFWRKYTNSANIYRSFRYSGVAQLEAGVSYDVKAYGKRVGSAACSVTIPNSNRSVQVTISSVSGSGAGGEIIDSTALTTGPLTISSADPAWQDIATKTIEVAEGEQVTVAFVGTGRTSSGAAYMSVRAYDDTNSQVIAAATAYTPSASQHENLAFSKKTEPLSTGSVTIKFQANYITNQWGLVSYGCDVVQDRGGHVPVEQDDVLVQDKPTAFNFVGSNLSAVDSSGQVDISTIHDPVTASASGPVALTSADSGKLYTNEGAAAEVEFTLPTAAADLGYKFVVHDANGIKVTAAAGDTIRVAGSATPAAGNITASTVGNTVKLIAINATEWIAVWYVGTWNVSV
jgi:hypothetical protein